MLVLPQQSGECCHPMAFCHCGCAAHMLQPDSTQGLYKLGVADNMDVKDVLIRDQKSGPHLAGCRGGAGSAWTVASPHPACLRRSTSSTPFRVCRPGSGRELQLITVMMWGSSQQGIAQQYCPRSVLSHAVRLAAAVRHTPNECLLLTSVMLTVSQSHRLSTGMWLA